MFGEFWSAYPKKIKKARAQQAWDKLHPSPESAARIIAAVEQQAATEQWQRDNGKYVPHPATWLNDRRWEDEVEDGDELSRAEIPLERGPDGLTPRERVLAQMGDTA